MGQVEEFWDNLRLHRFLTGKRDSPFSQEDIREAKDMGIDMNEEFIWWPAICEQFKIEFGMEMETKYGGNIANLMHSIHALVDWQGWRAAIVSQAPSEAASDWDRLDAVTGLPKASEAAAQPTRKTVPEDCHASPDCAIRIANATCDNDH